MKVLHLMVSGRAGGIESLMRDYVLYSGHENLFVFAWAGGPVAEQIEKSGCKVFLMNKPEEGSRSVFTRILHICEEEKIDAILVHHEAPLLRLAAMFAGIRNPNIRVFCYAHSNAAFLCDEKRKSGLAVRKWIYRITFRKADKALAISQSVKNSLVQYLGIPEGHIEVIYNGAILERFFHDRRSGEGKPLKLIYVGRLIEEKGVQTILESLSRLKDVDYRFTVVGDGDYREPLSRLAQTLGIGDKVEFLGTRSDVPELLARADVFVHLPACEEGFGIAVVEAMASGLLCICADRGALPEIVADGVNGFLIRGSDPDTLAGVIRDISRQPASPQYETIRANAVETAKKFSIEAFAARLDAVIEGQ